MDYMAQKLKEQSEEFQKLRSQQDFSEWISVEDRLPNQDKKIGQSDTVIVSDGKGVGIGSYNYDADSWMFNSIVTTGNFPETQRERIKRDITHWMSFPNPPNPRKEIIDILLSFQKNGICVGEATNMLEKLITNKKK